MNLTWGRLPTQVSEPCVSQGEQRREGGGLCQSRSSKGRGQGLDVHKMDWGSLCDGQRGAEQEGSMQDGPSGRTAGRKGGLHGGPQPPSARPVGSPRGRSRVGRSPLGAARESVTSVNTDMAPKVVVRTHQSSVQQCSHHSQSLLERSPVAVHGSPAFTWRHCLS